MEQNNSNGAEQSAPDSNDIKIKIDNLWKVFGRDAKRIISEKYSKMTKEEIHEKTGCIIGMKEVSLEVKKGEFYIIMGLSGSGKSTLIRNIIRLVNPTAGTIMVNDKNVTKMNEADLLEFRKDTYGMVFQHYGLFPHMTVLDNAAYGLKVRGLPKGEQYAKAMKTLETVGLKGWEDSYPGNLSGGMQQRVGLARALANDPEILLMDEPFSGLDPLIRRQMQDELVELQSRLHKTIVFVTHDLHEALKLGDRIAIMRNGEIVQIGTPEQIVTEPANDYVREFVQDASPAKVITAGNIMSEPEVLLYAWEGPQTAVTILQKEKRNGAFVVDKEHKLLGVANLERIQKALKSESGKAIDKISDAMLKQVTSVTEDTILEDLFGIVVANKYPVPVVSETGRLLGIVKTDDIFETISPEKGDDDD
jgi:glycine betaine/proline transport system ATP-binding protein